MIDFRALALSLPSSVEQAHFDSASFRVAGKIFAQLSRDGRSGLLKLSPERQEWMLATFPDGCTAEPHWGRYGWTRLDWKHIPSELLKDLLAESWRAAAPRKMSRIDLP
jgi:hypothetical protein